jgi:hypothetical protein
MLNGAGAPAANHTLLQPQAAFLRAAYPDLDPAAAETLFNRYAHVMPALVWAPGLVQADVVAVPPDPFAIALPVESELADQPPPGAGAVEQATATRLGPRLWGVMIGGWADWRGVSPAQEIAVALDGEAGRIITATAFRLPRPDVVAARGDPALYAAGFGLRLTVETPGDAPPPAEAFRIVADDGHRIHGLGAVPPVALEPPVAVAWPVPPAVAR